MYILLKLFMYGNGETVPCIIGDIINKWFVSKIFAFLCFCAGCVQKLLRNHS